MIFHSARKTLFALAMACIAVAPCATLAAEGGIRQRPLAPPGGPPAREPSRVPDSVRPQGTMRERPPLRPDAGIGGGLSESREPAESSRVAAFSYRGTQYVVSDGQWYERRGRDLVAVTALSGVLVKDLPRGHTMRWIGGVPYFYADGLYYVWRERPRRYEILQSAPLEETAAAEAAAENRGVPPSQ